MPLHFVTAAFDKIKGKLCMKTQSVRSTFQSKMLQNSSRSAQAGSRERPRFKDSEFIQSSRCENPDCPGGCVEVAHKKGIVAVRSTLTAGSGTRPTAQFTDVEWLHFLEAVKAGDFGFGLA